MVFFPGLFQVVLRRKSYSSEAYTSKKLNREAQLISKKTDIQHMHHLKTIINFIKSKYIVRIREHFINWL